MNQSSKILGPYTKTVRLKTLKLSVGLKGTEEFGDHFQVVVIMSCTFHITCCNLTHCYNKNTYKCSFKNHIVFILIYCILTKGILH